MEINIFNSNKFYKKKTFYHFYICRKNFLSKSLIELLEHPDNYCNLFVLKQDETFTTTVAKVNIDNKSLVIKRYNIKNAKHALKRSIQRSRAMRCFYYALLLEKLNINTPKPIAVVERRYGPFRRQAYFISEYIDGPDGFSVFRDHPAEKKITKERAKNTLILLEQLKKNQIYHGDLKASNFIYCNNVPYLLDLDSMQQYHSFKIAKRKLAKDENRFLKNWENLEVKKFFKETSNL